MLTFYAVAISVITCEATNFTVGSSNIQSPSNLRKAIVSSYGGRMIAIPPSTANQIYTLSDLTVNNLQNEDYTINFTTISTSQPSHWTDPIDCTNPFVIASGTCWISRDNYVYIIQQEAWLANPQTFYLIIYNIEDQTYLSAASYYSTFDGTDPTDWGSQFYPMCIYAHSSETLGDLLMIIGS